MQTTGSSFTLHPAAQAAGIAAPKAQASAPPAKHDFSFGDFLDIVNPLQHLPVVGTIYRAITGDRIKTPEKIVGDTLYGGPWGMVSSVADTLFTEKTGKSFGDTIFSFFFGKHDAKQDAIASATPKPTQLAAAAQSAPAAAQTQTANAPATSDVTALTQSLTRSGVNADLAQRALYAYRRTSSFVAAAAPY